MKIRSLLLGSIAAAGLATSGYAADLGVVTSLDVCDELGLTGLTVSSDTNCLQLSGGVAMEYSIGDYDPGIAVVSFDRSGGTWDQDNNDGTTDADLDIDVWLKFVGTSDSSFGPASVTIKLLSEDNDGITSANGKAWDFIADRAYVSVGDTTILTAGLISSIFKDGDDKPLNYLGLFNSSDVDVGVGFPDPLAGPDTGGVGIQLGTDLGNGLSLAGAVENLQAGSPAVISAVGTIAYAGEGITAHVSGAVDQAGLWKTHAGFQGTWDPITIVGAIAASNGWWNALGSASATFDMFTLAVSGEATSAQEWGVGGSLKAAVTDGVTLNLGGRYFNDNNGSPKGAYQVEAGIEAAVSEGITLTAAVGATDSSISPMIYYGKAGLAWAPGGGFTSSIEGKVTSVGGYKATFKAAKDFQ
jgi:hypothetical protein